MGCTFFVHDQGDEVSTVAERLIEATRNLPEPLLAEVADFAEFLQTRRARGDASLPDVPLSALCGGLERSTTFTGDPVEIQRRLRDEWA